MPLLFVRLRRLLVAPLVIAYDLARVLDLWRPPAAAKHGSAPLVQRPTHLLRSHTGIFPPAGAPCAWRQSPARSRPAPDAAATLCSPVPRNAASPPPVCPNGRRARPSSGGRPRPAPAPGALSSRCSGSTLLPPSFR